MLSSKPGGEASGHHVGSDAESPMNSGIRSYFDRYFLFQETPSALTEEENKYNSEIGRSMSPPPSLGNNPTLNVVMNDESMEHGLDICTEMGIDYDYYPNTSDPSSGPNQTLNPTVVDDLLSKDLMDMSVRDRTSISEELHGVRSLAVEENDGDYNKELVSKALLDLNHTLETRIPAHQKTAFLKAQSLQHTTGTYVNDITFRLKFLRSKLFDVDEAARLLINYLELVRELFGDVCLSRTIRLEDVQATKEERVAFRSGFIQLLPFGDRAGRRIVVISTDALHYTTLIRVKILLYIWTVASNDVATQQKGAILICWDSRKDMPLPRPSEQQLVRKLFSAIPLRICGIHFCFPDSPFYRMARAIFTLVVGSAEHRSRLRFHVGEEIELKYQVGTFGIPVSQIPITETGNIKTGSFHKWLAMRKMVEEKEALETERLNQLQIQAHSQISTTNWQMQMQAQMRPVKYNIDDNSCLNDEVSNLMSTTSFVEYPGVNDIAFRKGMSLMHHPGNDYFHGLIQSKMLEHDKATQTGKARIAWWVVDEVRKRNGRFLSWHQQGWWALLEDESKIRLRVAVFFREWKKHLRAEKNRQTMITSSRNAYKFQRIHGSGSEKSCTSLSSLDSSGNSVEND